MASKVAHHQLDRPLRMQAPDGSPLTIQVQEISTQQNDKAITQCTLTFNVDHDLYQQIDLQALFNLDPELRGQLFGGHFDPAGAIEIEAGLHPNLISLVNEHASNARELASYLFENEQEPSFNPLLKTESWLGLYVKQSVPLPPELAEETQGELKVGYQTRWVDFFSESSTAGELLQAVITFFQDNGWQFSHNPAESTLTVNYQGENGEWTLSAITSEEDQFCIFYSTFPQLVPPEKHLVFTEFLTRVNYGLPIGNFEFNLDSGEIRYKTSLEAPVNEMTSAVIERLVDANAFTMDGFISGLQRLLEEDVTPLEVLSDLEA